VDYKLELLSHSKIHPIFHVSILKKVVGSNCHVQTSLPKLDEEGSIWLQPEVFLDKREFLSPTHYPRGLDTMEGYTAQGCHMGTNKDPSTIPSSPALRTMLFLRGREC
jgi:hypothetical protein